MTFPTDTTDQADQAAYLGAIAQALVTMSGTLLEIRQMLAQIAPQAPGTAHSGPTAPAPVSVPAPAPAAAPGPFYAQPAPQAPGWVCPIHGTSRIVPAGVVKSGPRQGQPYPAFVACNEFSCKQKPPKVQPQPWAQVAQQIGQAGPPQGQQLP